MNGEFLLFTFFCRNFAGIRKFIEKFESNCRNFVNFGFLTAGIEIPNQILYKKRTAGI